MQVFQPSSYGNVSSVDCQQCSSQCDTQLTIILCWFFFYIGLQQMQKRIGQMDCVIEVHDARIPLSGRNPLFDRQAKMRPHILVLNKVSPFLGHHDQAWHATRCDNLDAQC